LTSRPETEIICWNLKREVCIGRIDQSKLVLFLKDLNKLLTKDSAVASLNSATRIFAKVRKLNGNHCLAGVPLLTSRNIDPSCSSCLDGEARSGDALDDCYPGLASLVGVVSFEKHNKPKDLPFEDYDALEFAQAVVDRQLRPTGLLSTNEGFRWVTIYQDLQDYLAPFPKVTHWEKARNALGTRWDTPTLLVKYPAQFKPYKLCMPSFIEGGPRPEWRCQPSPEGWNMTVNLENGEAGLSEGVLCPTALTDEFEYELLKSTGSINESPFIDNYASLRDKAII
jgi:hypothetical protein